MDWEHVLTNSVKNGSIRALYLSKIPVLKNCDNWRLVEPLGLIDYSTKHAHYKGALVHYKSNIYFVPEKIWMAVNEFLSTKIHKNITVIPE